MTYSAIITSDWHPDAVTAGYPRFDDVCAKAEHVAEQAIRDHADLFVFAGDLCDPDLGRAHQCAALSIRIAAKLASAGIPSYWLVGNHDVFEDGTGTSTLTPLEAYAATRDDLMVRVFHGPAIVPLFQTGQRFARNVLVALPYVARSHAYDPEAFIEEKAAHVVQLETGTSSRVIVVGHLMLEGISPGSETIDMARGRDLFFPIDKVLATWGDRAVMMNGHYHERQIHRGVQVIGSLERLSFGEEQTKPGYLLARFR